MPTMTPGRSAPRPRLDPVPLLLVLALAQGGCLGVEAGKGPDDGPLVNDGSEDRYSQRASERGAIEIGRPVEGEFDASSHHLYELDLEAGASVVVGISAGGVDDPWLDTVLRVYGPRDARGALPDDPFASDDDGGGVGLSSRIDALEVVGGGAYAVVVSTYGGVSAAGRRYRVEVACLSGECGEDAAPDRRIDVEVDYLGGDLGSLGPEAIAVVQGALRRAGLELRFHDDEVLDPEPIGDNFEYGEFRPVYVASFGHRGQAGWSYLVVSDLGLDGGAFGWGRLGGDMAVIGPGWKEYAAGERRIAEQAYMALHEIGHNLGLTHEGFDAEHPHDHATCAMPSGTGRGASAEVMPATTYCDSCLAHVDADTTPAWR